jgi:hypothetical protein
MPWPLYPLGNSPDIRWIRGMLGPRAVLDSAEKKKISSCRESNPGRPAPCPLLCQLSNSGSHKFMVIDLKLNALQLSCCLKPRQPSQYNNYTTGLKAKEFGSILVGSKIIFYSPRNSEGLWASPKMLSRRYRGLLFLG